MLVSMMVASRLSYGFLATTFALFPNVNRRAVHPRNFLRVLSGAAREHSPRRRQSSAVVKPPLSFSASSTFLQQSRRASRIVVHRPTVGQRAVGAPKIFPTSYESAKNVSFRNIVAALTHSSCDPPQCQLRGAELEVHNVDAVAGTLPRLEPVCA